MKTFLSNLNLPFLRAWWANNSENAIAVLLMVAAGLVSFTVSVWAWEEIKVPPKPKEITTQELAEQDMTWVMFLSGGHNALNKRVRDLETKIDRLERQMAGELPQIDGGVSYEAK